MNFKPNEIQAGLFILILHLVGIAGYLIPVLNHYFLWLTPFNLLLTGLVIVYFNRQKRIGGELTLLIVFLLGFFAEILGVKTGALFGEYQYGETLGFKVLDVPLIIGMNWLVLGYSFGSLTKKYVTTKPLAVIVGAAAMVLLDIIIEPIAIRYDYWSWQHTEVPLQNYLGWFLIALVVQYLLQRLDLQKLHKLMLLVILSQVVFFIALNILST